MNFSAFARTVLIPDFAGIVMSLYLGDAAQNVHDTAGLDEKAVTRRFDELAREPWRFSPDLLIPSECQRVPLPSPDRCNTAKVP